MIVPLCKTLRVLLGVNTLAGAAAAAVYFFKGEKLVLKNFPGQAFTPLVRKVCQLNAGAVAALALLSGLALSAGEVDSSALCSIALYHGALTGVYGASGASSLGIHLVQLVGNGYFVAKHALGVPLPDLP